MSTLGHRLWFLNTILHQEEAGFLGEIGMQGLGQGKYKTNLEHLVLQGDVQRIIRTTQGNGSQAELVPTGHI